MGRFLNADALVSTGQGVLGNNMFAYCLNNPVCYSDISGTACAVSFGFEAAITLPTDDPTTGGGAAVGAALSAIAMSAQRTSQTKARTKVLEHKTESAELYTVYFLYAAGDESRTIIYVGRVKTKNFSSRMAYHKKMGRLLYGQIDNLDYNICRALEQAGMMYFHTINREAALNNKIRGISPTNLNRYTYMAALWDYIYGSTIIDNSVIPMSYLANLTEEAFLNGTL